MMKIQGRRTGGDDEGTGGEGGGDDEVTGRVLGGSDEGEWE